MTLCLGIALLAEMPM